MSMGMAESITCSGMCWLHSLLLPLLSRVSLWLAVSERSCFSQPVSPGCASVQPSSVWCDSSTGTLRDLSLLGDNCHHLNPSTGSGEGTGFGFSLPERILHSAEGWD